MGREACSFTPGPAHMRGMPHWTACVSRWHAPAVPGLDPWAVIHFPTGADAPQERGWSGPETQTDFAIEAGPVQPGMVPRHHWSKVAVHCRPRTCG